MLRWLLPFCLAISACGGGGTDKLTCQAAPECLNEGISGVCLVPWCAFADANCPSGLRYGPLSGDALASMCVAVDAGVSDASVSADAAPPDGGSRMWSPLSKLAGVNGPTIDTAPWLTRDGLTLYMASDRGGADLDVYTATRSSVTAQFSTPVRLVEVSEVDVHDSTPRLSPDQRELYLSKNSVFVGRPELWVSTRATTSSVWGVPTRLGIIGTAPAVSGDGLALYYSSRNADGTRGPIRVARRTAVGAVWGVAQNVPLPPQGYRHVDISPDELLILLSSGTATEPSVVMGRRATKADPFTVLDPIPPLQLNLTSTDVSWGLVPGEEIYLGAEDGLGTPPISVDIYVTVLR